MKKQGGFVLLVFALFVGTFSSCREDEIQEVYLEGEPIPGVEIHFPLGYYSGEPLMPKISPDGKKLLFTGPSELPEWKGLWLMDLETQEKMLLHVNGRNGDWAPDSEWIVFNSGTQIFKMKIDGEGLTKLIDGNGFFEPSWSPEDDLIYFGGNQGAGIVKGNGADLQFIVELGGQGSWHPSGNKVISSKGYYSNSIWRQFPVYNIKDHEIEKIHDVLMKEKNEYPKYSPDGSKILFNNDRGIYIMGSDGSNIKRIVPSDLFGESRKNKPKFHAAFPSWHPTGSEVVYEHFQITKSNQTSNGILVEGVIRFYKVNAEDAVTVSNLNL